MRTNVRAWGNSYGIRLPLRALKESDIALEDSLDVEVSEGRIILTKKTNPNSREELERLFPACLSTDGWKFDREELHERGKDIL